MIVTEGLSGGEQVVVRVAAVPAARHAGKGSPGRAGRG